MYNSVVSNPNPTVNFYLGHSKKKAQRLSYSDSDNSASSTDSESDSDDKYYNVDADNYSGHFYSDDIPLQSSFQSHVHLSNHSTSVEAIDIYESCNYNNNNNNNINIENYIPVVTPPNTYNKSSFNSIIKPTNINHSQSSIKSIIQKATTIDNVGQVSYSYESIAMLTKAISQRSLPPTPPRCFSQSPQSPSPSAEFSNYTFTNDHPSFEYCPIFPSSILNSFDDSVNHNIKITPQTPCENKLIPINLEPVSPISLANDIKDSDIDCLDLDCAIYDEYNHDSRCNGASSNSCLQASFDTQLPDEITVSPEFLVGYEQDIISQLNLEEDDRIIDKFRIRPLLADGNRPFIPCSPVYASVEELFAKLYPDLVPGTRQYIWHLNRLERNRTKLRDLSQCIDRYDQVRRKRLSQSRSKEDKRFRARR